MGVGLIICRVGCNDGSCKFCRQNLYRGTRLGCLNGSYGPGIAIETPGKLPDDIVETENLCALDL